VVAVTLRVIAGAGAAVSETLSMSILVDESPPDKLTKFFGIMEIFPGLGYKYYCKFSPSFFLLSLPFCPHLRRLMSGPPLGGLLYQYLGFAPTFFINAGVLGISVVLSLIWIPDSRPKSENPSSEVIHISDV
jgi:predicted MFS family arabinose efflux permease